MTPAPRAGLSRRLAGTRTMAFAAAWLLAGCAALAPPGASMVSGRLALQVQPHEGRPAQGFTGSFELVGDARAGELRLSHALGVQVAQARWQPSEVVLTTADGERRFDDVDALAREALGQPLPLRALPDWLRGRP